MLLIRIQKVWNTKRKFSFSLIEKRVKIADSVQVQKTFLIPLSSFHPSLSSLSFLFFLSTYILFHRTQSPLFSPDWRHFSHLFPCLIFTPFYSWTKTQVTFIQKDTPKNDDEGEVKKIRRKEKRRRKKKKKGVEKKRVRKREKKYQIFDTSLMYYFWDSKKYILTKFDTYTILQ